MKCPTCGGELPAEVRFCPHCGAPVQALHYDNRPATVSAADAPGESAESTENLPKDGMAVAVAEALDTGSASAVLENEVSAVSEEGEDLADLEESEAVSLRRWLTPTRLIALGVVLVCLVVFGMGRHYGKQRQMYRRQLKEANALLYAGKTADAEGAYDNLIEIDKKRVEGYEGGAAALVAEKRLDQARQYLKKAAKIERTPYQLAIAANLDLARDQKVAAQAKLKRLNRRKTFDCPTAFYHARADVMLEDREAGIAALRKGIAGSSLKEDKIALYDRAITLSLDAHHSESRVKALVREAYRATRAPKYRKMQDTVCVGTPRFVKVSGTYDIGFTAKLKKGRTGDRIYYTADGSAPTAASTPYKGPIVLPPGQTTQVRAVEISERGYLSAVMTVNYKIKALPAPTASAWENGADGRSFSWKQVDGAEGYQIREVVSYPMSADATQYVEVGETRYTDRLSGGGYRVAAQVRAYVTVGGQRFYSDWSNCVSYDVGFVEALKNMRNQTADDDAPESDDD
ncbi:chitobiase/beta-hexosaminidase C-terminal domain-containing protein [Pseudoramibacter sp. HA2172]|uniref:chitobiase/beta-hexosaminidase C-terminal domain-containing protein n=1 Tax=Pseudoramibacter faecis TaxID=3108534 RepID=UPI002E77C413|nr:chitobiase/beta-hexosaminidase C-terminal domain-containing protein [Pseudoramibacter sp. HA2172]